MKKPQEVVELCEKILKDNNMAGIVIAMDNENGYYGLTLPHQSLFQWNHDDTKVKLALKDASPEQIEDELDTLKSLHSIIYYCSRAVSALLGFLEKASDDDDDPSGNAGNDNGNKEKFYVN